jgi:hypothetical protein
MGDETQAYDDAYAVLDEIISGANFTPLFIAASQLKRILDDGLGLQANFQTNLELGHALSDRKEHAADAVKVRRAAIKKMGQAAGKYVERATGKKEPKYKTPVFKCHGDYEECVKKSSKPNLCMALFVVCVGKQLLAFVRHSK